MKHIIKPIFIVVILLVILLIYAPLKFIWDLSWHFKVTPLREILTIEGTYLFEDINSPKEFFKALIYND